MFEYDCFRNVWQCAWIATWIPGILCLGHMVSDCKKKEVVYPRAIVNLDWKTFANWKRFCRLLLAEHGGH